MDVPKTPQTTLHHCRPSLRSFQCMVKTARVLAIGIKLATLACDICKWQLARHAHFIAENPWGSALWLLPCYLALMQMPGVSWAQCDQCMLGLTDPDNIATRKSTCFLGSCDAIAKRLRIRCDQSHSHVQLAGSTHGISRCKHAQAWPRRLCEVIISGIV